uniref:Methyltransferase type 11 domain-containing protein n=1 Tax=Hemiselmis andersenii TaxID=464988 RepID=A0A6T8PLK2_HEMAN|mmetsp:Transcript_29882/g.73220  ORF Transcript_29882/g.73220 Transcript_29882/m.73220 type:complete len:125 (-) Transcript_29882:201-575(-)
MVAIQMLEEQFATDNQKRFLLSQPGNVSGLEADITLSIDVIYHITDIEDWMQYFDDLFSAARKFVLIYAFDGDFKKQSRAEHVIFRGFTDYVRDNFLCWEHVLTVPPLHVRNTSASFYLWQRRS